MNMITEQELHGDAHQRRVGPELRTPELSRDTEASASFIAEVDATSSAPDTTTRMPTMYGLLDAVGHLRGDETPAAARAYREGNYGLLDEGRPRTSGVGRPGQAGVQRVRLLHMMTDKIRPGDGRHRRRRPTTAWAPSPRWPSDGSSIQILVYNHVNTFDNTLGGDVPGADAGVAVVNDLPFAPTRVLHYIVDHTHSNSHTAWASRDGQAPMPNADQWSTLATRPSCATTRRRWRQQLVDGDVSAEHYSASLIELRRE
jgi:hypothetical protein